MGLASNDKKAFCLRILREFSLNGHFVHREKSGYVCATDQGPVLVQKARADKTALCLAHYVKERLSDFGFFETDRFLQSDRNLPFFEINSFVEMCCHID